MDRPSSTRRQFGIGLAAATSLSLAGCLNNGDDGDDGSDDDSSGDISDVELDERYTVTMHFENEEGTPISSGIEGEAVPEDDSKPTFALTSADISEGTLSTSLNEGEYTVTVSSTDDSFDEVEEDVTVDGETEVTFTLEGAEPAE